MGNNGNGKDWWDGEKIFFGCQKCGGCCERKGALLFNEHDIKVASEYLEMKEETFKSLYLHRRGEYYVIINSKKRPCAFLNKDKTCRIQEAKPLQCKNYPFWPEVLKSKANWNQEKIFCKGIGEGKEYDLGKIVADEKALSGLTEEQTMEIMVILNCGDNYKIDDDGKCRCKCCFFGKDERLGKKIQEEGCQLYAIYLKMEKGDDPNASENK